MANDKLKGMCKDEVLSSYLSDWIEENHNTPQALQSLSQLNSNWASPNTNLEHFSCCSNLLGT